MFKLSPITIIILGAGTYWAAKNLWDANEKDAILWGAAVAGVAWAATRLPSVQDLLEGAPAPLQLTGHKAIVLPDAAAEAAMSTNAPQ